MRTLERVIIVLALVALVGASTCIIIAATQTGLVAPAIAAVVYISAAWTAVLGGFSR